MDEKLPRAPHPPPFTELVRSWSNYIAALLLIQGGFTYEVLRILQPDHVPIIYPAHGGLQRGGGMVGAFNGSSAAPAAFNPLSNTSQPETSSAYGNLANPLRPRRDPRPILEAFKLAMRLSTLSTQRPFDLRRDHHLALRWTASVDAPVTLLKDMIQAATFAHTDDPAPMLQDMLLAASVSGSLPIAKWLLSSKFVDPSWMNHMALRVASERGYHEIVALLVGALDDPSSESDVETAIKLAPVRIEPSILEDMPLRMASSNGHLKVVTLLLNAGADPIAAEWDAVTGASRYGHKDIVHLLLQTYLERKTSSTPPLDLNMLGLPIKLAAREGYTSIVSLFLDFIDSQCQCSSSPELCTSPIDCLNMSLGLASERGHTTTVQLLLTPSPSNLHRPSPTSGNNYALHHSSLFGHLPIVRILLPLSSPSTNNCFALRKAAARGHVDVVSHLLSTNSVSIAANDYEPSRHHLVQAI
ncbi:ankyrin repeat-containing domain protein [Chytridium lagenaria]|nr:ankyrin repeat-containing domain protein [Chytridium lagenaria]